MKTKWLGLCLLAGAMVACGDIDEKDDRPLALQPLPVEETINPDIPGTITVRDARGDLVDNNLFTNPGDVYLFGIGLEDGLYYYQVTDPQCTVLLAGPAPTTNVPDTANRVIAVRNGVFTEGARLAPFAVSPDETGRYFAAVIPVDALATEDTGCFGFPDAHRETAEFRIAR